QVRRIDDLLCLHAGDRHGERPPGDVLSSSRGQAVARRLSKAQPLGRHCGAGNLRAGTPRRACMQYLLMIHANEAAVAAASEQQTTQMMAAYRAYVDAMKTAGVHVGSNRLRPTGSATTVRVRDGKTTLADGPFAETKEQLGGYFL